MLEAYAPMYPEFRRCWPKLKSICAAGRSNPGLRKIAFVSVGPYVTGPSGDAARGATVDVSDVTKVFDFLATSACEPMMDAMNKIIRSRPRTLIFGDYRSDNIFKSCDG